MPRSINKCPGCGEPVTPFAMGCAHCGADIAAAREELAARKERNRRLRGGLDLGFFHMSDFALKVTIVLILALASPLIGFLLAVYFVYNSYGSERTIFILIALLAAIPLVTGLSLWGRFIVGY